MERWESRELVEVESTHHNWLECWGAADDNQLQVECLWNNMR